MKEIEPLCRIRDIYRCINIFEQEFYARHGIKLNEGMLLCSLSKMGECSSGQLSDLLALTTSNASKVIASAEKKELVERMIGSDDKRQMFFHLTEKGKDYLERIHAESNAILDVIRHIRKL